jgi:Ribbon-helix-helix domain
MGAKRATPQKRSERISVFLRANQVATLRAIHAETGIPVAVLIRRGVDAVLAQHGKGTATPSRPGHRRRKGGS